MSVKAKIMSKKWVQKIVGGAMALTMAASIAAPAAAPVSAGPLARDAIATTAAVTHAAAHVGTAVEIARLYDLPTAILNPAREANILMLQGVKLATNPLIAMGPVTRNVIGVTAAAVHGAAHVSHAVNLTKSLVRAPIGIMLGSAIPFSPAYFWVSIPTTLTYASTAVKLLTIPPMANAVIGNSVDLALLGAGTLGAGAAALGTAAVATPVVLFVANTPLRVARHATEAAVLGAGALGTTAVLGTGAALIAIPVVGTAALGTGAALLAVPVIGAGALGAGALGLGALGVGTLGALGLGAAALGTTAVVGTGIAGAGVAGLIALNALNNNDEEEPTDETTPTDTTKEASDKTSTDTDTTDYNANDQSYLEQAVHAIHDSIFGSSDETSTASENQLPANNTEATLEEVPAQA